MIRAVLAALSIAAGVAWPQTTLTPPQAGYMCDAADSLRPVYGIAGNFLLGDPVAVGVLSAAYSGSYVLMKTGSAVVVIDTAGSIAASNAAPDGPALFSFTRSGEAALVYLPATSALLTWKRGSFEAVPFDPAMLASRAVRSIATLDSEHAAMIVQRDDGLWDVRILLSNGAIDAETAIPGVTAPVLMLATGELVYRDANGIVVRKPDGSERNIAAQLPASFALQQMGEWMDPAARFGRRWAVRDSHHRKSRAILSAAGGGPMIRRLLLCSSILPLAALAQIQVLRFDRTNESPVGALVDVGTASAGDTLETRFRVRNIGVGPAVFQTLSLAGSGFRITTAPPLPYTIAPGSEAEFRVAFNPMFVGTYSAFLLVNTINITLRGSVAPSVALILGGSNTPLAAGAVIDFGSVQRGSSHLQILKLTNPNSASITVSTLAVNGVGFRGPIGLAAPLQIASGQSVSFQIAFEPQGGQPAQGTLSVDQRSFVLTGQGLDPPLPGASIQFGSATGASAQQNSISIPLESPSQVSGTGTLTLEFHSTVPGITDDAAVQFLSGPKRAATVTISAGDTAARFGSQSSIAFQTGSTAGTIVFTLKLPNATQQISLTIAPAAVSLDTAHAVRRVGNLDVSLIGFDNTYSASQLAFTFYDKNGTTMQPGVIRVDVTSDFRLYFATSQMGGQFALLATFPVTGDVNQVAGFDVQVTNSAGITKTQRITF